MNSRRLIFVSILVSVLPAASWGEVPYEESPFLFFGSPYVGLYLANDTDKARSLRRKYGVLPFIYHSASTCLEGGQSALEDIAEADLIWDDLSSEQAVEICIFRVAARLKTRQAINAWMIGQGWELTQEYLYEGASHAHNSDGPILSLRYEWTTEEKGARYGGELTWTAYFVERAAKMTIEIDHQTGVLAANYGGRSIWNK
jgi:hypothetical protein